MFKNKYRIVTDEFLGYEVQTKKWWFPIWLSVGINTFPSVESAEERIKKIKNKNKVIKTF